MTPQMAKIKLIEASSEIGAGTRGSSMGMQALRVASWRRGSSFPGGLEEQVLSTENAILYSEDKTPHAHRIEGLVDFQQKLSSAVSKSLVDGYLSLVIAGDHSNAIGSVSGTRSAEPESRLGVIWIDAHADLHSPYTSPSGNVHGMPLAALLDSNNEEHARNEPSKRTVDLWEHLKNVGTEGAKLKFGDLVFIALRDTEKEEDELIARHGVKVIRVAELREKGAQAVVEETLDHLSSCERIHVSFDLDSLDTSISVGTGTPVDDGLFLDEAMVLLNGFMADEKSSTLDIVEISPALDTENRMAEAVLTLLEEVTEVMKRR